MYNDLLNLIPKQELVGIVNWDNSSLKIEDVSKLKNNHFDAICINNANNEQLKEWFFKVKTGGFYIISNAIDSINDYKNKCEAVYENEHSIILKVTHKIYDFESYNQYKEMNISVNKLKINRGISDFRYRQPIEYIKKNVKSLDIGMCHGVRNNLERDFFSKTLKCRVLGTDISPLAKKHDDIIIIDFHNIQDEWIDKFDFIFSNSLDHSHSPKYAVYQWLRCLKSSGLCLIEYGYDKWAAGCNAADCFGATFDFYKDMFSEMGALVEIINTADKYQCFILKKIDVPADIEKYNRFAVE